MIFYFVVRRKGSFFLRRMISIKCFFIGLRNIVVEILKLLNICRIFFFLRGGLCNFLESFYLVFFLGIFKINF